MTDAERDAILALLERVGISPARILQLILGEMRARLTEAIQQREAIVGAIDQLSAELASALSDENVQIDSALTRVGDLQTLVDQLEANTGDPAALQSIIDQVRAKTAQISAALDPGQPDPGEGDGGGGEELPPA